MLNAIQFLETAGRNAAQSAADYAATVEVLHIDATEKQALLDRDHCALAELLDARTKMCCYIVTPDSNEPDSRPDDDDGGVPDQDEPAVE